MFGNLVVGNKIFREGGGGAYCLALGDDNECKAFKNGRCSIYDVRPDVCKLYPFYFDVFSGLFVHKDCPSNLEKELRENEIELLKLVRKRIDFFIERAENIKKDEPTNNI